MFLQKIKNFFSAILKHKKVVFSVLLFATVAGIALPLTVFAVDNPPIAKTCELTWYEKLTKLAADAMGLAGGGPLTNFVTGALWLVKQLAIISGNLSSKAVDKVLSWPVTRVTEGNNWAQVWISGWTSIKDVANMAIVLGFVVVGIATALRIQDYAAKKILLPLIIVALLINFSGLFVGLIIDAGTLINKDLKSGGGVTAQGMTIMDKLETAEQNIICQQIKNWSFTQYYMTGIYFVFIYLYAAIALGYLLFAIIDRYIILGFIFMLSPLAFVCAVLPFPAAKKLWGTWIDTFLKQVFIGVGISFVLFTSAKLVEAFKITPEMSLLDVSFYLLIVLTVIILGIKMTRVTGTTVARFFTGVANATIKTAVFAGQIALTVATGGASAAGMTGLKGLAMRAGGGMLDKASGGATTEAGQRILSRVGLMAERIGVKEEGSTDEANQARVAKKAKQKSTAFVAARERGDTATMDRIRNEARNGRGTERAAAVQAIVDAKDLRNTYRDARGRFDLNAANASLDYARAAGAVGIREKAVKQAPALAGEDRQEVDRQIRAMGYQNPATAPAPIRDQARQEVIVRVAIKTPEEELDRDFVDSMDAGTFQVVVNNLNNKKRETLKRTNQESVFQQAQALAATNPAPNSPEEEDLFELADKYQTLNAIRIP